MTKGLTLMRQVHCRHEPGTQKAMSEGDPPTPLALRAVPRISRLVALGNHMRELLDRDEVTDHFGLASPRARIAPVSRRL